MSVTNVRYSVSCKNEQEYVSKIHKVVVHTFFLGDVEDVEIYLAQPLYEWQQTDMGKFVIENSVTKPTYEYKVDVFSYGYRVIIIAELETKKLSEYYLKWGKPTWK